MVEVDKQIKKELATSPPLPWSINPKSAYQRNADGMLPAN
jgi:hypothetical protein